MGVLQPGVRHDHHELLAAQTAGQIDGADIGRQTDRELAQNLVAGVVAEAVVDRLKVVDVHDQDGDGITSMGRALHEGGELAGHVATIVQAGQRVGDGHLQTVALSSRWKSV